MQCMGHGGRAYTAEAQHGWSLLQSHRPCACMHAQLYAASSLPCGSSRAVFLHCRPFGDGSWPGLLSAWYILTGRNLASSTGWCTTVGDARVARARVCFDWLDTLFGLVRLQWGSRTALALAHGLGACNISPLTPGDRRGIAFQHDWNMTV